MLKKIFIKRRHLKKTLFYIGLCCAFFAILVESSLVYSYSDNTLTYNYDASGRLNYLESRSDRVYYEYDLQGNLISKTRDGSLNGTYKVTETSSAYDAYGSIQGNRNWYYQEWNGTTYANLQYKNGQWQGTSPYTLIINDIQHPDETDSVRIWVAPKSGLIRIAGNVAKYDPSGGDGVIVKILKNNIQLWSKTLSYNDITGYEVGLTVAVNTGDSIFFVVNKNDTNFNDSTSWKPVVSYMEANSAYDAYSSIQGYQNWYYQEWNGTTYTNLQYKNGQWQGISPYTLINKDFQHPDEADVVRKWVAPKSGMIRITGNAAKGDPRGGDGVIVKILKDNIQLWSKTISYDDTTGYEVGLTVAVNTGDAIYFVVNKNGTNTCDTTSWKPVVAYMEANSAYDAYGSIQGNQGWYYQEWNGTTYTNLLYKNGQWQGSKPYTLIINDIQHPDETDAVRKWVAPKSGMIRIAGNVAKYDSSGGDGVSVKIFKNNFKLWSKSLSYNDTTGYEVGLNIAVNTGDAIYFVVNKNGTIFNDATSWKPVVSYINSN
ncbi:hypothetical protein PaeBR_08400 [Paenibacillus sp. BR2-3]|uniref:hypothetical protein n=1 Tax=Paenibacillus sp. BR2-3 TaxID=3048494 RepID=UPI003977654A